MPTGIVLVFTLAMLCAASAVMMWVCGALRHDARLAKRILGRCMTPPAHLLREFDDLMHRSNLPNPGVALALWALISGAAAILCVTNDAPLAAVLALAASTLTCYAWLAWRARQCQRHIVRQLPAFLEGITRRVDTGHSIPAAFQAAAASMQAPLSACLERAVPQFRIDANIDQAFAAAARTYRVHEFELIGAVLKVSMKFGGGSERVLERMASTLRDLEPDEHAPAKLSAAAWMPALLAALIGCAVIALNPEYFDSMWTDMLGRKLVYAAVIMQGIGAYLLFRQARLDD
ncbi:type II secretion system F family protein [Caballeronia sp. LZ034LL]|uniref:type II secretion system F family protein n=1 Tax=Caballeronia sp. LZ034LL TaxID=3038567 RepID=UPI002854D919|nr:type II secretion system F family protein [Caballeronia sp. LZ034LL]MDR5836944.1 pilus assembly protein [Caballeronia sp. LZ034LL]